MHSTEYPSNLGMATPFCWLYLAPLNLIKSQPEPLCAECYVFYSDNVTTLDDKCRIWGLQTGTMS